MILSEPNLPAAAPKVSDLAGIMGARILSSGKLHEKYVVRLADTRLELQAAQRLRYSVFNVELHEGLSASERTRLDADPFDAVCDHLLVLETATGKVVGTYRLQTGQVASAHLGYYSAQEFDLTPFESRREVVIELGRACVDIQHRNLSVLGLLWKGIAAYAQAKGGRYLIGCSSLTSQDPQVGATVYADLQRRFMVEPALRVTPLPKVACPLDVLLEHPPKLPKLLSAYLSIGAKVCGPPAIDREFKTIDFLTCLDLTVLPPAVAENYLA